MKKPASGGENNIVDAAFSTAAEPSAFAAVRARVNEFSLRAGLSEDSGHKLTLILEELFTNLVSHGGGGAEITLQRQDARVHIRFSDDGAAFNALDMAPPNFEAGLEMRPIGGLGLHLVRQLTECAAYRRDGGRNVLDLELPLPARE